MFGRFWGMAGNWEIDGVIERIRKEINRIRVYIQAQPHEGKLTDVDTLLSVAESEAARHKRGDEPSEAKADDI